MSWTSKYVAAASLAAAAVVAPAVAMAGVVVSSSGPSASQYPVGRQIGTNERIVLRDGDTLTVLQNGGTRVFRGAGTYVLSQASATSANAGFQRLTTQRMFELVCNLLDVNAIERTLFYERTSNSNDHDAAVWVDLAL